MEHCVTVISLDDDIESVINDAGKPDNASTATDDMDTFGEDDATIALLQLANSSACLGGDEADESEDTLTGEQTPTEQTAENAAADEITTAIRATPIARRGRQSLIVSYKRIEEVFDLDHPSLKVNHSDIEGSSLDSENAGALEGHCCSSEQDEAAGLTTEWSLADLGFSF